jgi:hypothetical protein
MMRLISDEKPSEVAHSLSELPTIHCTAFTVLLTALPTALLTALCCFIESSAVESSEQCSAVSH